jgi:hypothetical protein
MRLETEKKGCGKCPQGNTQGLCRICKLKRNQLTSAIQRAKPTPIKHTCVVGHLLACF